MNIKNNEQSDVQPHQVNVVVKSKRDIPVNILILLVCVGIAFYGGFKLGAITLQDIIKANEFTIDSYKKEIIEANDLNKSLQKDLEIKIEQIRDEQKDLIEQAKRNIENSLNNVRKYDKLINGLQDEISSLKSSLVVAQGVNKETLNKNLRASAICHWTSKLTSTMFSSPVSMRISRELSRRLLKRLPVEET